MSKLALALHSAEQRQVVFAAMASLQTASARQLPGCSTTGRTHAQAQRLHYSHTVLRQSKCHAFGSSSFSSTCRDLKRCLPPKRRQARAVQTRAESTPNQEEAQLRADYGALSQRLEVNSTEFAAHSLLIPPSVNLWQCAALIHVLIPIQLLAVPLLPLIPHACAASSSTVWCDS